MKLNLRGIVVVLVLVSVCYASTALATDVKPTNASTEKKTTPSGAKKSKDVPLDAKKIKAAGGSTSGGDSGKDQDPAKSSASRSKKDHDAAEKVIDNLK